MKLTITTIAAMMIGTTAFAGPFGLPDHEPNGYRDTGCDPAFQRQITNEAGEVLYYNNPSCTAPDSSDSAFVGFIVQAIIDNRETTDAGEEEPSK